MFSRPLILGHRGASAVAPENTLAAFSRAMQDGADGIEFDVRLSRDRVPVVIHDDNLRRTGLTNKAVSQMTAAELQKIDVGSWFTSRRIPSQQLAGRGLSKECVPTLAQVLELFASNNGVLYVEMKCDQSEGALLANQIVQVIQEKRLANRVVVESFDLLAIAEIKRIDPSIRTSALFEPKLLYRSAIVRKTRMIEIARRYLADELALHYTLATPRVIEAAQKQGMEIVVWTIDDVSWIERARSMGIKALISNDPAKMVRQRNSLESTV